MISALIIHNKFCINSSYIMQNIIAISFVIVKMWR